MPLLVGIHAKWLLRKHPERSREGSFLNKRSKIMIKAVVGVLYSDDSTKVLMLKRRGDDRTATGWCFPGGKRDGVEDLRQTLIREFREETNLDIIPTKLMLCADSGKYRVYVYEVVMEGGSYPNVLLPSDEHVVETWATPDKALQSDRFPLAGPVTERVLNMIISR